MKGIHWVCNAELWWFDCCLPEQVAKHTIELSVIWNAMTFMWRHCDTNLKEENVLIKWRKNTTCKKSSRHANYPLQWSHNGHDGVSNHRRLDCLLGLKSKKTSKPRVTGLCEGNSPVTVNSPHKGSITGKMFIFDDVIMPKIIIELKCIRKHTFLIKRQGSLESLPTNRD